MNNIRIHVELAAKPLKNGRYKLFLRLSNGRSKKRRVATDFEVYKNDFNSKAKYGKWVRMSESRHEVINRKLIDLYQKAESKIYESEGVDTSILIDSVCDFLQGKQVEETPKVTFLDYFKKVIDLMYIAKQANTVRKYNTIYNRLNLYLTNKTFYFDDFSTSFLNEYDSFLKSKGLSINSVSKEFSVLKAVLYRGIREGLFPQEKNPFFGFKLRYTKSSKEKLNIDEIKRIEMLDLPDNTLISDVRNVWLFSLYNGGIRMGDLCRLRWNNIIDDRLTYSMNKTSSTKTFKLVPQALKILEQYKPNNLDDYIFPLLKNNVVYDEFTIIKEISSKKIMS